MDGPPVGDNWVYYGGKGDVNGDCNEMDKVDEKKVVVMYMEERKRRQKSQWKNVATSLLAAGILLFQ